MEETDLNGFLSAFFHLKEKNAFFRGEKKDSHHEGVMTPAKE